MQTQEAAKEPVFLAQEPIHPTNLDQFAEKYQDSSLKDAELFFRSGQISDESLLIEKSKVPVVNIDDSRVVTTLKRLNESPHAKGLVDTAKTLLECYAKIGSTDTPTGAKSVFSSLMSWVKNPVKEYWQQHQDLSKLLNDNFAKGMKYAIDAKNTAQFAKTVIKLQNAEYQKRFEQLAYAKKFYDNLVMICETELTEESARKLYTETYLMPLQDMLFARQREYAARYINYEALKGSVYRNDTAVAKFLITQPLANDVFHSAGLTMKIDEMTDQINAMTGQLEGFIDATLLHQVNTARRQNEDNLKLKQKELDSVETLKSHAVELRKLTEEAQTNALKMFELQKIALKNIEEVNSENYNYLKLDEQKEKERETSLKQISALLS